MMSLMRNIYLLRNFSVATACKVRMYKMEYPTSSDNESYSSSNISFEESSNESCNEDVTFGYTGEPEYNDDELKSMKFSSEGSNSDESENELNSSRLENLHWCKCQHCTVMPTFIESRCCKEFSLLEDKLQEASCITLHKDFDVLLLHKTVLETAFIRHRRFKNNFTQVKEMTTK